MNRSRGKVLGLTRRQRKFGGCSDDIPLLHHRRRRRKDAILLGFAVVLTVSAGDVVALSTTGSPLDRPVLALARRGVVRSLPKVHAPRHARRCSPALLRISDGAVLRHLLDVVERSAGLDRGRARRRTPGRPSRGVVQRQHARSARPASRDEC
jgi:hypothetical protein